MTLKVGDTVEGRYKIIKELDHGGMGSVFLAEHQLIKRRVALKLLRTDLAEDVDALERFMNEARAAGTLGHPNIVESTDMGFTREGVPYIVFELLEGSLLTDEIYRVRGLPVRRALRIARQIASALHAAHTAGVIHRDLKSDNIFLTDRDEAADHVKVLDFGISQFLDTEDKATNRAMVVGTPQFMAPEQITSPERVDRRTDVYALGVIIYEMLTARRPFEDDNDPNVVFARIVRDPPAAMGIDGLPPGLEVLLYERFLAKDPGHRFATMQDAEGALAAFAGIVRPAGRDSAPIPFAIPPTAPPAPAPADVVLLPPPPTPGRANLAWLVAAVLAAGAGGALTYVDRTRAETVDPGPALVRDDAAKIAGAIEAATRAAQLRADGLAQAPMLRSAIETDAATVQDMLRSEFALKLSPGEVFELVQVHDGPPVVLSRVPPGSPIPTRADNLPRLRVADRGLEVVVSSPVQAQNGAIGGAVALAAPIDLAPVTSPIAAHATGVTLRGLATPLPLVPAGPPGTAVEAQLQLSRELGATLTLAATTPLVDAPSEGFRYVRFGAWGFAGIMGIAYVVSLLRARRRG